MSYMQKDDGKQQIMTICAKNLLDICTIVVNDDQDDQNEKKEIYFDTSNYFLSRDVVMKKDLMDDCPLFFQLKKTLGKENAHLGDKIVILDFESIFNSFEMTEKYRARLAQLFSDGFFIRFVGKNGKTKRIHMTPFDKSGNMSRNSRITFIDDSFQEALKERLNLGIDFSEIKVVLSKFYAYRGLYLTSSKRIGSDHIAISKDTLIVVKDKRTAYDPEENDERPVIKNYFHKESYVTAECVDQSKNKWEFKEVDKTGEHIIDKPYDGEGVIVPEYAKYLNEALNIEGDGATSFQIRLPFVKGMLHQVDVCSFIEEFDKSSKKDEENDEEKYLYVDAFEIERDLRKAKIFITESMFKCIDWLREHCEKEKIEDPMEYYCTKLEEYDHALYISGTSLPYGNSKYTHLSYQILNTLYLDETRFKSILEKHCHFIDHPIDFVANWDEEVDEDDVEKRISGCKNNWEKALLLDNSLKDDVYIRSQLKNIPKGLISKIALGKLLVEGETRYLVRDLFGLLASLLRHKEDITGLFRKFLYYRFYMPGANYKLEYNSYYAFFRNPHLSRNEQVILRPLVETNEEEYPCSMAWGTKYEDYCDSVKIYNKYFGHLKGIVMLPRNSSAALCLGGADFDGDTVSIVYSKDVVDAVKDTWEPRTFDSAEEKYAGKKWSGYFRILPAIDIPTDKGRLEKVPKYVPYTHILNTFSNKIGEISNRAINLGQIEYGRENEPLFKVDGENRYKSDCAKCTVLVGLEIDAAKNGKHPNLEGFFLSGENEKETYVAFNSAFKKLKANPEFDIRNLKFKDETKKEKAEKDETKKEETKKSKSSKKETPKDKGEEYKVTTISLRKCNYKPAFQTDLSEGTYINELPKAFVKQCKLYKSRVNVKYEPPKMFSDVELTYDDKTDQLKEKCASILSIYLYYKRIVLKNIKDELARNDKADISKKNLMTMLEIMFDKDVVQEYYDEIAIKLYFELCRTFKNRDNLRAARGRIIDKDWMYQPYEEREKVLLDIIGNGFSADKLTSKMKTALFNYNNNGYKLLWFLISGLDSALIKPYSEVKLKGKRKERLKEKIDQYNKDIEPKLSKIVEKYYKYRISDVENRLYITCLLELKRLLEESDTDSMSKICIINQLTSNAEVASVHKDISEGEDLDECENLYEVEDLGEDDDLDEAEELDEDENSGEDKNLSEEGTSRKDPNLRRFFWDLFEWDELKVAMEADKHD